MGSRDRKVVVTGGAGAIGSFLVDRLLADGVERVIVLDNFSRGHAPNLARHRADRRLEVLNGDVRDADFVRAATRAATDVYHLAAQSTVLGGFEAPAYTFATNVVGTFNVLRAAIDGGASRVIFASSCEVYGEPISVPVEEGSPLQPINLYGASKVAAEAIGRACRREHGLRLVCLRFSNIFGSRDFGRVIPNWLERAQLRQELEVYGGEQVLDFLWVGHAVEALLRAAEVDTPLPPINVGSGTGTSLLTLAQRISRLVGRPSRVRRLPARPMEVQRFVADVERMRHLLQLEPPLDPLAELPLLLEQHRRAAV